jgi:nucleoside-diphosphate-sugar epimerase
MKKLPGVNLKVLVTGGAGFIGSHLSETLAMNGHEVTVIDSFSDFLYSRELKESNLVNFASQGILFQKLDLSTDLLDELVQSQDVVINQAGIPGLVKSWSHFSEYMNANVFGLSRLLESVKRSNVSKFIQISTSSVYGKKATGDENSELNPYSPYGVSKLAAENLVRAYSYNFGIPFCILRYFSVYGPRQRPDMAYQKFISAILKGEEIEVFGDGSQTRTNTFVSDIVNGTILAMESRTKTNNKTYNLSGVQSISLSNAISEIQNQIGQKAKIKFSTARFGDQKETLGDISLAKKDFGYSPVIDFTTGINRQIIWNRNRDLF